MSGPSAGRRGDAGHLHGLDALRGLAATVVVVCHCLQAVALPAGTRHLLSHGAPALLLNAQGAVQLFFVLSGYVLARSLARGAVGPGEFWIRRIFRIHPPYVFAVLFAWYASSLFPPIVRGQGLTRWLQLASRPNVGVGRVLATLGFPGEADGLLWVGWTLRVEMIFSLLMPLLVVLARPRRGVPLLLACAAILTLRLGAEWPWYAIDFALGLVIFQERRSLETWLGGLSGATGTLLLLLGAALLAAPHWLHWAPRGAAVVSGPNLPRAILVMGLGSGLVVAVASSVPAIDRALSVRPLLFLGRISFSLYLLHLAWISLLAPRIVVAGSPTSPLTLVAAVLAASVASATVAERWVERPSISCGKALAAALCRRRAATGGPDPGRREPERESAGGAFGPGVQSRGEHP